MTGYESKRAAAQDKLDSMEHEALKLALKVLEDLPGFRADIDNAITAIKEALAQPAQEPVAYLCKPDQHGLFNPPTPDKACKDCFPVYTTPPQRPWVGLEGEEIRYLWEEATKPDRSTMTMVTSFAKDIEAKLKEKNT